MIQQQCCTAAVDATFFFFHPHHIKDLDENSDPLLVTHYHFTQWPDHGVPASKVCLISFIKRVRKSHPPEGPSLLVHCSAGVGRTGTFIVLDTMLQRMKAEDNLNIFHFVSQLRKRRTIMVQNLVRILVLYTVAYTCMISHLGLTGSVYVHP